MFSIARIKTLIEMFAETKIGRLKSWPAIVFTCLLFAYGAFHFYTAYTGPMDPVRQRSILIGIGIMLALGLYPASKKRSPQKVSWWEIAGIALACLCTGYFFANSDRITVAPWIDSWVDVWISCLLLVVLLEATRRTIGTVIPGLVVLILLYTWLGHYAPGMLKHREMPFTMVIGSIFISTDGIWGLIPGVMTNTVAIFILFGAMLLRCGLGKVLIDLVLLLGSRATGGAAKVAVIGSSCFGTASGSAVANVALTGSMTIPMMKSLGYKPEFAAATEATASTGGQIMPPIMGAAAFLMAELLGIPYAHIVKAAILPALIYYIGVWASVHLYSSKNGLKGLPSEQVPSWRSVLTLGKAGRLILAIGVLMFLILSGLTPNLAGFWAMVSIIVPYLFLDFTKQGIKSRLGDILRGIVDGGLGLVGLAVLAGSAQIIVATATMTPLVYVFSGIVLAIAGGVKWVILVLVAILAMIFGMGMPTSAAYVVVVALTFGFIKTLGLPVLAAHMFIFYYACMSSITPPVCPAVYVAAPIAEANWIETAWRTLILACGGFIVPFIFIDSPGLLFSGPVSVVVLDVIRAGGGVICISAGLIRYLRTTCTFFESGFLLVASGFFLMSGLASTLIGIIMVGVVYGLQQYRLWRDKSPVSQQ